MKKHWTCTMVLILVLLISLSTGLAQAAKPGGEAGIVETTETDVGIKFTYQGQLTLNNSTVNGTCDMQFSMFDSLSGTGQIGSTRSLTNVSVTDGRFTVQLYYGIGVYQSGARWLEVSVRCPAGSGTYTKLSPRQQLTPVPVALSLPGLYTIENAASPNIIGGYSGNSVGDGVVGATISGGGAETGCGDHSSEACFNQITANYGTIGGGRGNVASAPASTVSGGGENTAYGSASYATVGGGLLNKVYGWATTVSGGEFNTADNTAAIGGGERNTALGWYATIPGGANNVANGWYSFAAGQYAEAAHRGAFVWSDASTTITFTSSTDNQFLIQAVGGVGVGTNDTLANGLTVNGQVIAGGTATGVSGGEPFVSRGSDSGISMDDRTSGSSSRWVIFPNNGKLNFWKGTTLMQIHEAGGLTIYDLPGGASQHVCFLGSDPYTFAQCSSSARYKTNIVPLNMGLEVIEQLRPVAFDWKENGETDLGLVAEEVNEVSPLLTTYNSAGEVEGVKYDQISAVMVNAMQEQQDQIAELKTRLAEMEQGGATSVQANQPINHWMMLALVVIVILLVIVIAQSIFLRRLVFQQMNARAVRNEA